jgi:hypothetical protein
MYINTNTGNTIRKATQVEAGGITYPKAVFADAEKLNSLGIYKLTEDAIPNRRYYTYSENINVETKNIDRVPIAKPMEDLKAQMLKDLSDTFKLIVSRPRVETSLGFYVDGSKDDIKNFEVGKKHALPNIKDADGIIRNVTVEDYDSIITEIELFGLSLYQKKWAKEAEVMALNSVEEVILYENEPYEYVLTEDDIYMSDQQVGDIVIRYKNNLKEW